MYKIKLIVTGDVEELALHESLRRMFPDQKEGMDVTWVQPRKMSCATTCRLVGDIPTDPMRRLARAMLAEAISGGRKQDKPADFVVVLDDVELANVGREDVVARQFRAAVEEELSEVARDIQLHRRYRDALAKCSFHLIKPMIESYFFGDDASLRNIGVGEPHWPQLAGSDVEQFEARDSGWLAQCAVSNQKKWVQPNMSWWREECHPKRYLVHLLEKHGKMYTEAGRGRDALTSLDWPTVPKDSQCCCFLRALFEDIADWFGVPNPLGPNGRLADGFYPARSANRNHLLLRNM